MKNLFFLLSILFLSNVIIFSQGDPPAEQQVIFLGIFGLNPTDTRNFTTTAQGTVWGNYSYDPFSISVDEAAYQSTYQQTGNSDLWWEDWGGWDLVTIRTMPEVIGWGLYKITTDDSPAYFYYNTRDCHFAFACGGYNPDARFQYLSDENIFQYYNRGQTEYIDITNGQVINSWDMLNYGSLPSTNGFEDYWGNALVLVNNGNNRPKLIWGKYPTSSVILYLIYRDESGSGNFTHIATVNNITSTWTDNSVVMDQPGQTIYYKVKAFGKEFTNTVSTTIIPFKIGFAIDNELNYSLSQNYPNPFNPTTIINYAIREAGLVKLKVYDILGREVAVLVDGNKESGSYSVSFDASGLSSGIYFYTLSANNNVKTSKMILAK